MAKLPKHLLKILVAFFVLAIMYHFFFKTHTTEHFYANPRPIGAKSTSSTASVPVISCTTLKEQIETGKQNMKSLDEKKEYARAATERTNTNLKQNEYNSRCLSR